jgi:hypothetical protein
MAVTPEQAVALDLKPYTDTPSCPRCPGTDGVSFKYRESRYIRTDRGPVESLTYGDRPVPHLHVTCNTCGYLWFMETKGGGAAKAAEEIAALHVDAPCAVVATGLPMTSSPARANEQHPQRESNQRCHLYRSQFSWREKAKDRSAGSVT